VRDQRTDARALVVDSGPRSQLRETGARSGVRRRLAPHQLRHGHPVEIAREGVPLLVIQRQLGHTNLGITSIYWQGIDSHEIIDTVHARRAPMVPSTARYDPDALNFPRSSRAIGASGSVLFRSCDGVFGVDDEDLDAE
jgi:hypothetical protein